MSLLENELKISDSKVQSLETVKRCIADRYKRILSQERRPSMEYMETQFIRTTFEPFVNDPEKFKMMSDTEIQEFFSEWCIIYKPQCKSVSVEGIQNLLDDLQLPDIVL